MSGPHVVGLGGGHGLAATLAAARTFAGAVDAVVSVADDGGSSGRLRRDLGIPAPGDVRRCLVALAADPAGPWAVAFGARFSGGELHGHATGNIVLAALAEQTGSFATAIDEAGRLLGIRGRVFPATTEPVTLVAELLDGSTASGQTAVEDAGERIDSVRVEPAGVGVPPAALEAIAGADMVVLGPGSLFTSVLAVVAIPAIGAALRARRAGVVYVCNLRPSKETIGFGATDHLAALERHGVVPHVAVVDPAGIDLGAPPPGVEVVSAPLARPDGWSHDVGRLAAVLQGIAGA